jgi:hypothetical protein
MVVPIAVPPEDTTKEPPNVTPPPLSIPPL